jgi:F0F1-type ATP synthase assembly protein I
MASAPSASRSGKGGAVGSGGRSRGAIDVWRRSAEPVLSIVLGVLLGVVDAASDTSAMGLRVPALLAGFLMVAQGVLDLNRNRQQAAQRAAAGEAYQAHAAGQSHEAQTHSDRPREPVYVPPVAARPTKETLGVPLLVLGLAIWLGLTVISLEGAPTLRGLSLLSAFLLFSRGWSLLPARK